MSTLVHKNDKVSSSLSSTKEQQSSSKDENKQGNNIEDNIKANLKNISDQSRKQGENILDFEQQNRRTKVIALYTKGLSQVEIAEKIGVNQSTISRDIQYLQQEAKKQIWKYMNEDILIEYLRFIVANNEISKELWTIINDKYTSTKEKTYALSLLSDSSIKRIELLINGPEALKNVKKNISEIKELDEMENDPFLKFSDRLSKLPQLPRLGSFRRR